MCRTLSVDKPQSGFLQRKSLGYGPKTPTPQSAAHKEAKGTKSLYRPARIWGAKTSGARRTLHRQPGASAKDPGQALSTKRNNAQSGSPEKSNPCCLRWESSFGFGSLFLSGH
jgi:hypothetical protein